MKDERTKSQQGTASVTARWVALAALFLIPITPLLVADTYFFPFITGKAFYFRILAEILVCAWAVLALLDKEYRPRFSWIGVAVVAFVAWMFVADLFALNAAKAFWSNFERMEGWILLVHLLGVFFASSAMLRVEKKWHAWFLTSIGISIVVAMYALFQIGGSLAIHQGSTRVDATFGNSAYLAIYLFFNVCLAVWLALTEKRSWLAWALAVLAVFEGVLIFFTQTRGTVLALVGALALAALLTAATAGKRLRGAAIGVLALVLIAVAGFYAARDSVFVQQNAVLQRIASISLADGQTRFTLWRMALQGVAERPVVGWGQEGFNYVFNKYYDPSLYTQESWFDRAHNTFIDWLMAGGVPAFVLYIALFVSAIFLLWRRSEFSRAERIVLTAALVGYATHNLFVFDNLYSYIYFFAILAFLDSKIARPVAALEEAPILGADDGLTYALPLAAVVAGVLIWTVNVPGMRTATVLISAISPSSANIEKNISTFEYLAAHPAFVGQEIREQLVSFASSAVQDPSVTDEDKQKIATLAITEMQKQVAAYPLDARERLQLSYIYRASGDLENALKEIEAAAELSPKKEDILLQKGVLEWDMGDARAAQEDFAKAYALGPQFKELAVYVAAGYFAIRDVKAAEGVLQDAYGTTTVSADVLAVAYYRTQDWRRLIDLWKVRANAANASAKTWFSLASAYYAAGDTANAIQTIRAVVARYPETADSGAAAIAQIEGKTTGR